MPRREPWNPNRFLAVDPGLANTAAVLFDDGRIAGAWTFTSEAAGPRPEFASVMDRACATSIELLRIARDCDIDGVVMESYRDIPGHLREARLRWTTPAVCAFLAATLGAAGFPVVWQDPELVGVTYGGLRGMWASGKTGLVPGDEVLQKRGTANEHTRAAASHGVAFIDSHKAAR